MPYRLEITEFAAVRLGELTNMGAEFSTLAEVLNHLENGTGMMAKKFHDHALDGKLKGFRSAAIGQANWLPAGQRRIIAIYTPADDTNTVTIVHIDLHDQAYAAAK